MKKFDKHELFIGAGTVKLQKYVINYILEE